MCPNNIYRFDKRIFAQPHDAMKLLFMSLPAIALTPFAHANAGTGIMIAQAIHFLFLNILLGIGEGIALYFLLPKRKWRWLLATIPIMILANYVSGFVGLSMPANIIAPGGFVSVYNARWFIVTASILAYFLTLVCEWPFFLFLCYCFKAPYFLFRSIWTCLLVQTVSCAILAFFYYQVVSHSIPPSEMLNKNFIQTVSEPGTIHYISPDREWCSVRLNGEDFKSHGNLPDDTLPQRGLHLKSSFDGWQLCMGDSVIDANFAPVDAYERYNYRDDTELFVWLLEDFRPEEERSIYHISDQLSFGIHYYREEKTENFFFEPLFRFMGSSAWGDKLQCGVILPGNRVVFQCFSEIVVLDIEAQKAGVLARGYSPIYLPDSPKQDKLQELPAEPGNL